MERLILFVAYYYAILLCAYVFVFQVLTGVCINYHLLKFLLFMLVHMSVFLMQCSCQPKFHVRDNKVLTYLLTLIQVRVFTMLLFHVVTLCASKFSLDCMRLLSVWLGGKGGGGFLCK